MPQLKDNRKVVTTAIPSVEGSEVKIYDSLLIGDMDAVMQEGKTDVQRTVLVLLQLIQSWNLTDAKNEVLPVTVENLGLLQIGDLEALIGSTSYSETLKGGGDPLPAS